LSNLDAPLRAQMRSEIARLQESMKTTTVYVTHDQTEALAMGHRLGVMRDGKLEQTGAPREVYDRPATMFVARFIGSPAMNMIDGTGDAEGVRWKGGRVKAQRVDGAVIMGVRPEHIHIRGSRWAGEAWGAPVFHARIERMESLGDQMILAIDASGESLLARVEPTFEGARGDTVVAWLDPRHIHLFDPGTGSRV
jgi:multiple sugar transport system ATP-binding protein